MRQQEWCSKNYTIRKVQQWAIWVVVVEGLILQDIYGSVFALLCRKHDIVRMHFPAHLTLHLIKRWRHQANYFEAKHCPKTKCLNIWRWRLSISKVVFYLVWRVIWIASVFLWPLYVGAQIGRKTTHQNSSRMLKIVHMDWPTIYKQAYNIKL